MLTKLKNFFFPPSPVLPKNDLLTITSREKIGNMIIVHGICKKTVTKRDVPRLTKVLEKSYGTDVYVTVDSSDLHKVKFVFTIKT